MKQAKNTICIWYDGDAEEAAQFYAKTFPDSSVGAVYRAPGERGPFDIMSYGSDGQEGGSGVAADISLDNTTAKNE